MAGQAHGAHLDPIFCRKWKSCAPASIVIHKGRIRASRRCRKPPAQPPRRPVPFTFELDRASRMTLVGILTDALPGSKASLRTPSASGIRFSPSDEALTPTPAEEILRHHLRETLGPSLELSSPQDHSGGRLCRPHPRRITSNRSALNFYLPLCRAPSFGRFLSREVEKLLTTPLSPTS